MVPVEPSGPIRESSCGPGNHTGANPICSACGVNAEGERAELIARYSAGQLPDFIANQTDNPDLASDPVRVLAAEIGPWSRYNFPGDADKPERKVLGIVEEWGELVEAAVNIDRDEVIDAAGDVVVYAADLCSKLGLDLNVIYHGAETRALTEGTVRIVGLSHTSDEAVRVLGKLAHHSLKASQGIRGKREEHVTQIAGYLETLFMWLHFVLEDQTQGSVLLADCVAQAWGEVRLRDWQAKRREAAKA